jgi:hypothetical protein
MAEQPKASTVDRNRRKLLQVVTEVSSPCRHGGRIRVEDYCFGFLAIFASPDRVE